MILTISLVILLLSYHSVVSHFIIVLLSGPFPVWGWPVSLSYGIPSLGNPKIDEEGK
jgi:hypothetical protein